VGKGEKETDEVSKKKMNERKKEMNERNTYKARRVTYCISLVLKDLQRQRMMITYSFEP
jgi:hypothetical protein